MDKTPPITITVSVDDEGQRLDRFCAGALDDLSRSQVQSLNTKGGITVDGRVRPDSFTVSAGESVWVDASLLVPSGLESGRPVAQDIPVPVIYEDEHIVVVNKPMGMVTHPAHGNWDGTLVNALLGRGTTLSMLGSPERPGVVHRLDKDTSGLIVLARTDEAYRGLVAAIKDRRMGKVYHAIAFGGVAGDRLTIDAPIARHPVKRQQMAVVERSGKPAHTELFVVDRYSHFDYIRVTIFTGRTHQIRVHLSHIGHPLLGDSVYGGRRQRMRASGTGSRGFFDKLLKVLPRHALHASRLSFEHPVTGAMMSFTSALPADMRLALETIYREDRTKEVLD